MFYRVTGYNLLDAPIYLRTFGSFGPKQRAEQKARLIQEKRILLIDPHAIPSFKPSLEFTKWVKGSGVGKG